MSMDPLDDHSYVHPTFISRLDFNFGLDLAQQVRSLFSSTVNSSVSAHGFHLVISFGRATFGLNAENVGWALESFLGAQCFLKA